MGRGKQIVLLDCGERLINDRSHPHRIVQTTKRAAFIYDTDHHHPRLRTPLCLSHILSTVLPLRFLGCSSPSSRMVSGSHQARRSGSRGWICPRRYSVFGLVGIRSVLGRRKARSDGYKIRIGAIERFVVKRVFPDASSLLSNTTRIGYHSLLDCESEWAGRTSLRAPSKYLSLFITRHYPQTTFCAVERW